MSLRGLLVLVVLLAGAIGALVWLGRAPAPAAPAASAAPLVPSFAEDAALGIELACDGATVTLRKEAPASWRIVRPFEADADPRRVHEIVAALQDAKARKVIAEGKPDLAAFGLAPAGCTVRVEFDPGKAPLTLRLGRSSPVGSERYAATDDARVVLADGSLYATVARGPEALREKRLIPCEPGDVTKIVLTRPAGRLALAMTDAGCRLEAPLADAASPGACEALARALTALELSGTPAARPESSGEPNRRVRIEVRAKQQAAPMVAFVAAAGIEGKRLAWREGAALAGLVDASAASALERPVDALRETRIVALASSDVRRLDIDRGATALRIARDGPTSAWTVEASGAGIPLDGSRVDALLERLRGLTAAGFEAAAPASPATATIAVAGANGELARLAFGTLPASAGSTGTSVWVTTPSRPGAVFRVDATALGDVPQGAADLAPAKDKP